MLDDSKAASARILTSCGKTCRILCSSRNTWFLFLEKKQYDELKSIFHGLQKDPQSRFRQLHCKTSVVNNSIDDEAMKTCLSFAIHVLVANNLTWPSLSQDRKIVALPNWKDPRFLNLKMANSFNFPAKVSGAILI